MKLKNVEIENMFQHGKLNLELDGNLIGVVGPNGSGKSNLLNAIHFGFGGEVPGKTKDQLLSWGAESGGVKLDFEHAGVTAKITRSASKNFASFQYGSEKYTGTNKVAVGISDHLGVDKDVLRMIFVRQAELDAVLFEAPSKRETAFQRMCGVGESTRVHKKIGDLLTDKFPPVPNYAEQISVAAAERVDQDQQMVEFKATLAELHAHIKAIDKARLTQDKATYSNIAVTAQAGYTAFQYMEQSRRAIEADTATVVELDRQLVGITLEAIDVELQNARTRLDAAKTYQRLYTDWTSKQQAIDQLGEAPCNEAELTQLKERAAVINTEVGALTFTRTFHETLLQSLDLANEVVSECPLCGSEMVDIQILRQRLAQEIAACKLREAKLDKTVECRYKELQPKLTHYTAQSELLYKQLVESEDMLKAAEQVTEHIPKLEADIAGMVHVRTDLARLFSQREQCITRIELQREQFEKHKIAYDIGLTKVSQINGMDGIMLDKASEVALEHVTAVEEALVGLQQHEVRASGISGQISMLQHNMNLLDSTIIDLKKKRAQEGVYKDVVATLVNVRAWFHYTAGPHDLAISVLNELTEDVNAFLGRLNAPFTVLAEDTGLSYKCIFTDGRAMPAEGLPDVTELSGGQKVMLAIAFRLASYCMFANKQGLLSLDEPTVYLDEDNVGNFCTLLGKIKDVAQALDLQILISTHERAVIPFMDTVIDLTPVVAVPAE